MRIFWKYFKKIFETFTENFLKNYSEIFPIFFCCFLKSTSLFPLDISKIASTFSQTVSQSHQQNILKNSENLLKIFLNFFSIISSISKNGYRYVTQRRNVTSAARDEVTRCKKFLQCVTSVPNIVPFHENFIIFEFFEPKNLCTYTYNFFSIYVYVHLKRFHFWGFSLGDTAIFPKLGPKYCFCVF